LRGSLYAKTGNLAIDGIITDLGAALKNGGDHPLKHGPTKGMHPNCTDPCPICDHEDAERWRALIGCARVRVIGSAGIHQQVGTTGYAHIGVELWTHHEASSDPVAIDDLTAFADRAIAAQTKEVSR
jgi:hypothetical protein